MNKHEVIMKCKEDGFKNRYLHALVRFQLCKHIMTNSDFTWGLMGFWDGDI